MINIYYTCMVARRKLTVVVLPYRSDSFSLSSAIPQSVWRLYSTTHMNILLLILIFCLTKYKYD